MFEFSIWHWAVLVVILSPVILGIALLGLQKSVRIIHLNSGLAKNGYVGYSWTYLVFGWFVPMFRGELGIGVLHFAFTLISAGLSQLIFPFIYNRQYMTRMLTSGWQLDSSDSNYDLVKHKLNVIS
jgi:hypothetical protein